MLAMEWGCDVVGGRLDHLTVLHCRADLGPCLYQRDLDEVRQSAAGFLLRVWFCRPDSETGDEGIGYGRWWHVPHGCSRSAAIKTIWLALRQIIDHELHEGFVVRSVPPFNPHADIDELVVLHGRRP